MASRCGWPGRSAHARSSEVFPLPAGAEMIVTFPAAARSRAARRSVRSISRGVVRSTARGPPFACARCPLGTQPAYEPAPAAGPILWCPGLANHQEVLLTRRLGCRTRWPGCRVASWCPEHPWRPRLRTVRADQQGRGAGWGIGQRGCTSAIFPIHAKFPRHAKILTERHGHPSVSPDAGPGRTESPGSGDDLSPA